MRSLRGVNEDNCKYGKQTGVRESLKANCRKVRGLWV